jgi:hypothetical protein
MMSRRPRGYVGSNHVTLGSDILAVLKAVHSPERILGAEMLSEIRKLKPDGWYPIELLLGMLEVLDKRLGRYGLISMGSAIFKQSHEEAVKKVASSARDILYGFDEIYRTVNRGDSIGGWKVVRFEPGHAELEKTTPHHCVMEEGIVQAALIAIGVPADISQSECFRRGADCCRFVVTSPVTNEWWSGKLAG